MTRPTLQRSAGDEDAFVCVGCSVTPRARRGRERRNVLVDAVRLVDHLLEHERFATCTRDETRAAMAALLREVHQAARLEAVR
jgi:hypothetical protein